MVVAAALLLHCAPNAADAQMPIPMPAPTPAPSHKTAEIVGIAILAGVVAGTVLLIEMHRSHHAIQGCISSAPNGLQLQNSRDGKTYILLGSTQRAQPGEIMQLLGSREKAKDGDELAFVVKKVKKDYGPCPAGAPPAVAVASLSCIVSDASTQRPIANATVTAGDATATTDAGGRCVVSNVPTSQENATATAPGYDQKTVPLTLEANETVQVRFQLQRHHAAADIEGSIGATGTAALRGVTFDTNSATLRPDSLATLQQALAVINKRPNSHWVISGYTDNKGSDDVNQRLSDQRAGAVMDWLIEHGIDESRLTAKGYGSAHPVADNSTEEGRAQNRRVELTLVQGPVQ